MPPAESSGGFPLITNIKGNVPIGWQTINKATVFRTRSRRGLCTHYSSRKWHSDSIGLGLSKMIYLQYWFIISQFTVRFSDQKNDPTGCNKGAAVSKRWSYKLLSYLCSTELACLASLYPICFRSEASRMRGRLKGQSISEWQSVW